MRYWCKHLKSGFYREEDILQNTEFNRRYGHFSPRSYKVCAQKLIDEWNNSVNNRDKDYLYGLCENILDEIGSLTKTKEK